MSIQDNQFRYLLKVHENILTVSEVMNELYKQYEELGYRMHLKLPSSFSYYQDATNIVLVYWENGKIYENFLRHKLYEINCRRKIEM